MPQFTIIEEDAVTDPRVSAIYEEIKAELGFGIVPNLFKSMAAHPAFLAANWTQFRGVILQGKLPRTLKEMIGVAISQSNNSEYALKVHLHGLSALGISEEVLRLLDIPLYFSLQQQPLPDGHAAILGSVAEDEEVE